MRRIFVSAYACEPGHGSEIGVGWHWVLEMSKHFELWVLTRESNQASIEPWVAEHPEFQGIHFLYFDLPKWARFWKKGLRGVRTYYNIWQVCTNGIVKRTMQENGIRIFHHLTYGNVLWKVSGYGQRQFFVWGPVGGLETIPAEYSRFYGARWRVVEWIRRWVVASARFNSGFRRRCKNADLILCKTGVSKGRIPTQFRDKAVLMTDVAVDFSRDEGAGNCGCDARGGCGSDDGTCRFLTVGRLDAWRGFDLAVESFAAAAEGREDMRLTIVGNGSDRCRLQRLIKEKGMEEKITMTGGVSMKKYRQLLAESDVVINASLKEGAVTVSFDCMAAGKPLVCLDTTGYTRYFADDYAVVIPVGSRKETIDALRDGMIKLTNPATRKEMGEKALSASKKFSWETRGNEFAELLKLHI